MARKSKCLVAFACFILYGAVIWHCSSGEDFLSGL